jgi:hypothetical protein
MLTVTKVIDFGWTRSQRVQSNPGPDKERTSNFALLCRNSGDILAK